jgi:hypothetical protein
MTDKEIISEIEKRLHRLKLNFRHYRLAEEKKRMKLDWVLWLESECEEVKEELYALELNEQFKAKKISAQQRNELWTKRTGLKYGQLMKYVRQAESKA